MECRYCCFEELFLWSIVLEAIPRWIADLAVAYDVVSATSESEVFGKILLQMFLKQVLIWYSTTSSDPSL